MTIMRRLGIGYAVMAAVGVLLLVWLGYHEFIQESAAFAARGVSEVHGDTAAELSTICFLGILPAILGFGWWWTRRLLAPLRELTHAAAQIESNNLRLPLPRSMNNDEVDQLAAVFGSMTQRLDDSFQQIREFTLHASHELKTPLTIMQSELETALKKNAARSPGEIEWMESLHDEVLRLARIVDSLTLLMKADAGLVSLERTEVNLGELVQEALEDALALAEPAHLKVALLECDSSRILGDRHRLRQLLLILIDNAVKYNRPEGHVQISLREHAGLAELRVANDGALSPETRRRLFRRFARGENAIGRVEGCGLGLTIAQWIVEAHGGTIDLQAEAGDKSVAIVRLPLGVTKKSAPVTGAEVGQALTESEARPFAASPGAA